MLDIKVHEPSSSDLIESLERINNQLNNLSIDDEDQQQQQQKQQITTSTLSSDELNQLYKRLPEINTSANDQKEFFQREKTVAPARSGQIVKQEFPPAENVEKPQELIDEEKELSAGALRVVRFSPEGNIGQSVPNVTITFSQDMISLSSVDEVEKQPVPVTISPMPKNGGRFRWVGTKTVLFEPEYRFDMSTEYTVTISASNTKSIKGAALEKDVTFSFTTPTAKLQKQLPNAYGEHPVNEFPVYYLEFDQTVDPRAIMQVVNAKVSGKSLNISLLTTENVQQILKNCTANRYFFEPQYHSYEYQIQNAPEGRHVWFTVTDKVEVGQAIEFTVGPGVPSLEGPLKTTKQDSFTIRNYPIFAYKHHYPQQNIVPLQSWSISLTNPINPESFQDSMVSVTPELPNLKLSVSRDGISVQGKSKGRTTYTVTLSKDIQDVYGQHLGADKDVTFNVGPAAPSINVFQSGLIILDPTVADKPEYTVVTVNLPTFHLIVSRVNPLSDYKASVFNTWDENYKVPGNVIVDTEVTVATQDDLPVETSIDLTEYLQHPRERLGQVFIYVEPSKASWKKEWRHRPKHAAWIQVTNLAIDYFGTVGSRHICWANSLRNGSTVSNAEFSLAGHKVRSDASGLAELTVQGMIRMRETPLVCTYENDVSFVVNLSSVPAPSDGYTFSVFNDRGLYKPKETVNIKGFLRNIIRKDGGATYVLGNPKDGTVVNYKVQDARYQEFHSGSCTITGYGSFHFNFTIPDNINLGNCIINLNTPMANTSHSFQCLEFRTPEYSVSANVAPGNYVVNGSAVVSARASYYSGGGLSGAKTMYTVTQQDSSYSPPGWNKFTFQQSKPIWFYRDFSNIFGQSNSYSEPKTFESVTDSEGEHKLCIDFKETDRKEKRPVTITTEVAVQDINRQTINSSTRFIVHPSHLYVGVKNSKTFVKPNVPYEVELIVTNIDGKPQSGVDVSITATTTVTRRKGYEQMEEDVVTYEGKIQSGLQPVKHEIVFEKGGYYELKFNLTDKNGLTNTTGISVCVYGGRSNNKAGSFISQEKVTLISDQDTYQPGQDAKIFVQSPFEGPCEGICFVSCSGVVSKERFSIPSGSCTELTVPILKKYIPNINVEVHIVGQNARLDDSGRPVQSTDNVPMRPAYASGSLQLLVPATSYELNCTVTPKSTHVTPGSSTEVDVLVKNAEGNPVVNSEVTLVAVDEAVLSLTGYSITNPISHFYQEHSGYLPSQTSRSLVLVKNWSSISIEAAVDEENIILERSGRGRMMMFKSSSRALGGSLMSRECAPMMMMAARSSMIQDECADLLECDDDGGADSGEKSMIKVRSNFDPLAIFAPLIKTDANGVAKIPITFPDNLTRYRVTAVVVHGDSYFGLGESQIISQLPVAIRPSLPRFLNFGDKAEFSCVLQNQTNSDLEINVAIQFANLKLTAPEKAGLKVRLPPLARSELSFPMEADQAGTARFQVGVEVVNGEFADAVEKELPVFTPATSEAFATYGEIDDDGSLFQPIKPPAEVYPQFGGLQITTSSTALQSLTDAFLYLIEYKFQCNEQIASRLMSIVTLKDVLQAFNVPQLPSEEKLAEFISNGLQDLYKKQSTSGAYGFWKIDEFVSAYVTVHVAHCFARCKMQGYPVSAEAIRRSINCLKSIETIMTAEYYSQETRWAIRSYAYYVLALLDDPNAITLASSLWNEAGINGLSMEGLAWIAFVMFKGNGNRTNPAIDTIIRHFMNRSNETAETANFITSYGDNQARKLVMLHSSRRTDAIILDTLMTISPKDSLIPKLVKGLLAHKKKGRWESTQENIFCLISLHKYFMIYEAKVPDFVLQMWLGDNYVGEQTFKGRSTDQNQTDIPMNNIVSDNNTKDLIMSKKGEGRMYYRIGMTYAPKNLFLAPRDYGFIVERTYEAIADKSHVSRNEDGVWMFKAGELVRVRITLSNVSRRYQVAMVDKLPAGLEVLNPELSTTGTIPTDEDQDNETGRRRGLWWCWWRRPWYEHQNLRDERVEAFASLLWEGVHKYSYVCRATSIGEFVVPPTHVEEMYSPEIFGRSSSDRVIVYK